MADTNDRLLNKAVDGDPDALTELLREFGPQVRQRISGKIAAPHRSAFDEDDVMQVTYLEAFLRIDQFAPSGEKSFLAWLTRIAENNLRDAVKELQRGKRPPPRKRVTAQRQDPDGSYVTLLGKLGGTMTTPSRHAAGKEAKLLLDASLAHLPADYREVIRLYDLENLAATEVAKQMSRSIGAVYMLRARALDSLHGLLPSESKFFSRAP